jgi:thiamine biosynthesis lipoprotein
MPLISRRRLILTLAGGAAGAGSLALWTAQRRRIPNTATSLSPKAREGLASATRESQAFGTKVSVTALHPAPEAAARAAAAALNEIGLVDRLMSLYSSHSQLSQLNRQGVLDAPHPYLVAVLRHAQSMARQTNGAFDVTVQPLWDLYARAQREGATPDARAVQLAAAQVDWRRVEVTPQRVKVNVTGTQITLNGIAQGFAADRAMAALQAHGVRHALVNSGEIGALGGKNEEEPWTVGIQHPRNRDAFIELARLQGRCLATSGDYAAAFDSDYRDHHIFDPRTGHSPDTFSSVSVAARTGIEADALSTAVFVLGLERGLQLIQATAEADAFFVLKDGRTLATRNFPTTT